jgi:hypothetical protein
MCISELGWLKKLSKKILQSVLPQLYLETFGNPVSDSISLPKRLTRPYATDLGKSINCANTSLNAMYLGMSLKLC